MASGAFLGEAIRFPIQIVALQSALYFLLVAGWEEWSTMQEVDWRGFRVPWIYTLDEDLFVRPVRPPNPDSLTLEPWIVEDHWGEEICCCPLKTGHGLPGLIAQR